MSDISIQTPKANRKELAEAFGQNQSAVRRIEAMTQDITITLPDAIDGSTSIAEQALALAKALQQVAYLLVSASTEVPNALVIGAGVGISISSTGGTLTVSLSVPVSVENGGTGLQSLTQHAVIVGNGTSAPNFAVPGTAGQVLMSNGAAADPSFQATVTSILAGTGINVSASTGAVTVSLQTPVVVANGGTGATSASGTALDNITGFSGTGLLRRTGAGTYTFDAPSTYLQAANNLSDVANAATARSNLGLGSMATQSASSVAITGGAMNGVTIGATTPEPATVTTFEATGNVGLGGAPSSTAGVLLTLPVTGATSAQSFSNSPTIQSNVTTSASINYAQPFTAAASFTITEINYYDAVQGTFGSGSTVTNQYGFRVRPSLTGAANNYGFRGQLASAAGRWNLYMDGTATNYLAGNLQIGSTTATTGAEKLQVGGSISISSATMLTTYTAFTNGAGAATGTLTNAPVAGNPTKWVPVNDNGTTRYIPMW